MPHELRRTAAASVLAGVLAMTGCLPGDDDMVDISSQRQGAENGLDELTPSQAVSKVIDTLKTEGSFHVTGTMDEGAAIDMTYLVGKGATGTIGDSTDDSPPVELVSVDGRIYVAGDEKFLVETVGEEAAETIGGKWLMLGKESAEQFGVLADGLRFAQAVLDTSGEHTEMTGVSEVDGRPAVGLLFRDSGAKLWVAARGEPVPIRLEKKGASGGNGVLKFTDIGADVELAVPDDKEVVDAADLESD